MPSTFTYYSALALAIFIFASAHSPCSCSTLTKSEMETETEPELATVTVTDGSEIGDGGEDLNLCYGPPLSTGRICESRKALLNFARLSYRVVPLKNSNSNTNSAIPKSNDSRRNGSQSSVNSDNNVCCEGRGTAKGQELWVPLGCGQKVFSRTTYFDGLISFPAIRCTGGSNGVFVKWSY